MSIKMTSTNRLIVAILIIAALGALFWTQLLSPKRDEAKELKADVEKLEASLAQHRAEVREGLEARKAFPVDYQQLVVLAKAVPGDDDTASLMVQLNKISEDARVDFRNLELLAEGSGEGETPAPESATGTPVSATEAAASTLPLGAEIGPAGLAVMPYSFGFKGRFFELADFFAGLDKLVRTTNQQVTVNGRLYTIDGFTLEGDSQGGFPDLEASVGITTYLTPPDEGITAGATPAGPAPSTATPAAATLGGTP